MDYTQLIAHVQGYDPGIKARPGIPMATLLIELEAEMRPLMKHYLAEKTVTIMSTGDVAALPDDFIELRQVNIGGKVPKLVSVYGSSLYTDEIGYLMTGNTIQFVGTDGTDQAVELTYYADFPGLSEANPTNWVLSKFPGIYIHGLLARVYRYLQNPTGEGPATQSMTAALSAMSVHNQRYSRGGNQIIMEGTSL